MKKYITKGLSFLLFTIIVASCSPDSNLERGIDIDSKKASKEAVPDYAPTVFTFNSSVIGSENVDFNIFFAEYNNVDNNANGNPIYMLIRKQPGLTITYDQNLTTLNNQPVENSEWSLSFESSSYYYYQYIGNNGIFPGGTAMYIGFNATLECSGDDTIPITAELKSSSGGQTNTLNDEDSDFITCNVGLQPDFQPEISVSENVFNSGNSTNFDVVTQIENIGGDSDGSSIELRIVKSSNFSFTYDNTLTIVNGSSVNNNNWSYDGTHPSLHRFIYTGGSIFSGSSHSNIGLNATYTCPANSKSEQPLKATVKYFSGGEQNNQNNNDLEYLECSI